MRKFRLIEGNYGEQFEIGMTYDEFFIQDKTGKNVNYLKNLYPEDWELVKEVLLKDTDLGYFAGLAMQGLIANAPDQQLHNTTQGCELAIWWAEELIRQLKEESINHP